MTDVFTHPWLGGLFDDPVTSAALAPTAQLQNMLLVERAYTTALQVGGAVNKDAADAVIRVLSDAKLDMDALRQGTGQDGMIVPSLIRQLKAQLPAEHHHALHLGLTSQDVIDTAFALSLKSIFADFLDRLNQLDQALDIIVNDHGDNTLMGRTRMQAALPIMVKDRVAVWHQPLKSYIDRLQAIRPKVEVLSIGGPVGTRPVDDIARYMADQLQLTLPVKAPHAMRGHLADLANVLSIITGTLGKIGQDIALMAQQGIDDIEIAGGGGSSAMAHKHNPIQAELLVTLARFNATQLAGMHHTMVHEQERSGTAWTLEWMLLPPMLQATGVALQTAHGLVSKIERIGQHRHSN